MAEGLVLAAIRRTGVPLQRIRPALARLQDELGLSHVLASRALYTDGAEVIYDFAEGRAGDRGGHAPRRARDWVHAIRGGVALRVDDRVRQTCGQRSGEQSRRSRRPLAVTACECLFELRAELFADDSVPELPLNHREIPDSAPAA